MMFFAGNGGRFCNTGAGSGVGSCSGFSVASGSFMIFSFGGPSFNAQATPATVHNSFDSTCLGNGRLVEVLDRRLAHVRSREHQRQVAPALITNDGDALNRIAVP